MRRVRREFYGVVARIPPHEPGALAQCAFCEWGKFFADKKRTRYSALARAASSLRSHARRRPFDLTRGVLTPTNFLSFLRQSKSSDRKAVSDEENRQ